jgi:hypothetical protein
MSEDVFILFGDIVHRVNDDRSYEAVLEQIVGTFPEEHLEIPVHLQPRGFENVLLEGVLLIGSNTTVCKIVKRMPWPGKADDGS